MRPRFTVLDAIENLHRLDKDFLQGAGVASTSRASTSSPVPSSSTARTPQDAGAIEELLRVLGAIYDYIVIDAGNMINACAVAALYAADTVFLVTNPDVPSIRNAQRLVDRVRQLGAGSERVKILLNRVSDQHLIAPKQIETALGYGIHHTFTSDYRTVSTALNSGVPLALTNQLRDRRAVRQLHTPAPRPARQVAAEPEKRRAFLGLSESGSIIMSSFAEYGQSRPRLRPRGRAPTRRGRSTSSSRRTSIASCSTA